MQYMIKVASYVIIICLGHNFGSVFVNSIYAAT